MSEHSRTVASSLQRENDDDNEHARSITKQTRCVPATLKKSRESEHERGKNRNLLVCKTNGTTAVPVVAPKPVVTPVVTPVTPVAPAPTPAPVVVAPIYTLASIASHNNASSCYSAISGNVYNLTAYVNSHPGGSGAILGLCGRDGTASFTAQHGNSGTAKNVLAGFRLGALQ